MIRIDLQTFLAIHEANYTDNERANEIAAEIAANAGNVDTALIDFQPLFDEYCEITD